MTVAVQLFDKIVPAIEVLAKELEISPERAKDGLIALIKAGWVIGPLEPSNAMFVAYAEAVVGTPPRRLHTVASSFGKARKRWKAMGLVGTNIALTMPPIDDSPPPNSNE